MFFRSLLVLLALVVALMTATADAQPSRRNVSRRVSDCSNRLTRFGARPARLFCVAYLKGRQPRTPVTTLSTTQTTTLAAATTTIPVTVTSTETMTETETTTTTLSTSAVTQTTNTLTVTPKVLVRETATVTETVTVIAGGPQRRRRSVLPTETNPVPLDDDDESALEKRSALTISQAASIYGSFLANEITEACLLIVYGRTSNPTQQVTSTVTATSTPAVITASPTTTVTVTDTETDTLTETVTTTTATSTVTIFTREILPTQTVTSTVGTVTVTTTTTVAPAPTTTTGILRAVAIDGLDQYITAEADPGGLRSVNLRLVSNANLASRVTYDSTTRRLLLASDTTLKSATFGAVTRYVFRMAQDGVANIQNPITCTVSADTKQLSCSTVQGFSVLQKCGSDLYISNALALYCVGLNIYLEGEAVSSFLQ